MIPESKGLIYSYKDFVAKDLELDYDKIHYTYDDINTYDSISYNDLTTGELSQFIRDNYMAFCRDINSDGKFRNKYFFKEFVIKYQNDDDLDLENINRYTLSTWNSVSKHNGIDDRTLEVDLLYYDKETTNLLRAEMYKVKVEHIYQLIKDLNNECRYVAFTLIRDAGIGNTKVSREEVNLFVLPIYILENGKYQRISDVFYGKYTYNDLHDTLSGIWQSLRYFVATNFYMLDIYNNNDRVSVYNRRTKRFSNMTFKAYTAVATNDKKVYAYTDRKTSDKYSSSVEIDINTDRYNIYAGTDIPRKLCDYRYMVRGHLSHRWVGKRGNQHLEEVWIDPYEKNKDKPYRIIKETRLN